MLKCIIDQQDLITALHGDCEVLSQIDALPSPPLEPLPDAPARDHKRSPHDACRDADEMFAVFFQFVFSTKPEICLVDQCGWLQVVRPLAPHVGLGQATQFLIDERERVLLSRAVRRRERPSKERSPFPAVSH